MHDIVAFLRGSVDKNKTNPIFGCYIVREGSISAFSYKDGMQAGISMESDSEFNVPAGELDAALSRIKEIQSITVFGNSIVLKGGRLRTTIQCHNDAPPALPTMPEEWWDMPAGLVPALKLAQPFLNDMGWNAGAILTEGKVIGVRNNCGIEVQVAGLHLDATLVLPPSAIEFLIGQDAPASYAQQANSLFFQWLDGRWFRTALLAGDTPPSVFNIFDRAGSEAPVAIDQPWRDAYADIAALAEGAMTLTPTSLTGIKEAATTEIEIATAVPEGHTSRWAIATMEPILACATAWNPQSWPEPTLFVGPGLRGIVMGAR